MAPNNSTPRVVMGQPSWRLASSDVEAFVTRAGGMVSPVVFDRRGKKISPYSVSPWAREKLPGDIPVILKVLRGDFFCLPFGGNAMPYKREKHPVHGETANADWRFESLTQGGGETTLHLSLRTKIRPGRVDKTITLIDGHATIYSRHIVSEMSGPMNLGHHATLKFPDGPLSGLVSTSAFVHGQVFPGMFENPAQGGYSSLKAGAAFKSLKKVPAADGSFADLSRYPAHRGFEDLVMVVADPKQPLAWTAVSFPKQKYVWFALKDPSVLASTVIWMSNGGRYYAPWNGRHAGVMGLEEVTANFHYGLAESVAANENYPTVLQLDPRRPTTVNYIMACVAAPAGFDRVKSITPDASGKSVILKSENGKSISTKVDVPFLYKIV